MRKQCSRLSRYVRINRCRDDAFRKMAQQRLACVAPDVIRGSLTQQARNRGGRSLIEALLVELSQSLSKRDQSLIEIDGMAQESRAGDELGSAGEHCRSIGPGAGVA